MGVKITEHQTLVAILSSIKKECQLLKNMSNQLKLILVCSPLILLAETWTGIASRRQKL